MAVRRIGNNHTLPPNPEWVDFPRSDGDQETWPKTTSRVVVDGEVNFFRPVGLDESLSIMWRKAVGPKIAAVMGLPEGKPYVLRSFPERYQLFDHNKGKPDNPRHDAYLYGSNKLGRNKFRSVNEFIPHAMWLAKNDPTAVCECKYCSGKKKQTEISQSYGLSARRESASVSTPPPRQRNRPATYSAPAHRTAAPYAAVRRPPKHAKPAVPTAPAVIILPPPKQTLALEKSNDILNALTNRDVQHIRYFRKGELVWCALDPPILGPRGEEDAIRFWPGLIDVVTTKAIPIKRPDAEDDAMDVAESASRSGSPKAKITWSVKQQTSYKIKLLALAQNYHLSDDEVLPYLSYAPSELLLESLRSVLPQALQDEKSQALAYNPDTMSDYNPLAESNPVDRFNDAITPYTLAIQIASHIATYWSPTDEYDCKLSAPSPSSQTPTGNSNPTGAAPSLQDVLNAASQQNARSGGSSQPPDLTVSQQRYQGLWWGAERIWGDELVRLKLSRSQFAPQGAQTVYPPSGPSEATMEWYAANGETLDVSMIGATEKGMFMKIESMFVVDTPRPDGQPGTIKECRASGMIYELADEGFEDPNEPAQDAGSGKEASSASAVVKKEEPRDRDLSRPILSAPFPLPDAPKGYKFRPILQPGNECVLSLSLIAGRYYPYLFKHPLMVPVVERALQVSEADGGLMANRHLWAMEGLLPGMYQSMDPEGWKGSRYVMLKDADVDARKLLGQEIDTLRESASLARQTQWSADVNGAGSSQQHLDSAANSVGPSSISAAG
ncbi:hypothetical protein BC629DRAFT_1450686 [Irpex lacteus]|nr:hypothetical protein BC629DRAFT_1450686 [Irpex lacteus]